MKIVLFFTLIFTFYTSFCQTGPAGVGNSFTNSFWVKADGNTSTIVNGAAITDWYDHSGNGIDVSQPNIDQQPLYTTGVMNGRPSILFDDVYSSGQNDFLEGADDILLDNTDGFTLFTVVRPLSNSSSARSIFSKRTNVGVNQAYMFFFYGGNNMTLDVATNNNRFNTGSINYPAGNDYIMTASFDGTLETNYRSKIYSGQSLEKTSSESSSSLIDYNSPLTIGTTHVGDTRPFDGYISEIIFYRKTLNITEKVIVDNYLSSKYNIALTANDKYQGDTPLNGNYDFEVAGIGQTSAADSHLAFSPSVSGGLGVSYNAGFQNGDYLMIGNNVETNTSNLSDINVLSGGPIELRWERIWYVDVTNSGAAINADLTFDISDGQMGNNVSAGIPSDYKLLYRTGTSGDWTIVSTAVTITGDQISFNHSFSTDANDGYYTIGTLDMTGSPLPIELLSFEGELKDGVSQLSWITASEINNDYFEIEKSTDGVNFESLGKVTGAGNSTTVNEYKLTDNNPSFGNNYYRLSQVDFDGTLEVNGVVVISNESNNKIVLYPNPFNNVLNIKGAGTEDYIQVYDLQGRLIKTSLITSVDLSDLKNGIYSLSVFNQYNQRIFTEMIVKK